MNTNWLQIQIFVQNKNKKKSPEGKSLNNNNNLGHCSTMASELARAINFEPNQESTMLISLHYILLSY